MSSTSFIAQHTQNKRKIYPSFSSLVSLRASSDDENEEDEDEMIDISNRDWRAFRAQLVMDKQNSNIESSSSSNSKDDNDDCDLDGIGAIFSSDKADNDKDSFSSSAMNVKNFTPLSSQNNKWAFDQGKLIEQGAVILGGIEQEYGFGLRQQYFHKVVMLVLDHDESTFTKGIILNRPTDHYLLQEKENKKKNWRVWFGGDVQNLDHSSPEIICLHTLDCLTEEDKIEYGSKTIINNIQYVSFEDAQRLCRHFDKKIQPSDFWCFAGYAGWAPQQLKGELDRKSWYMCSTDSGTLLEELQKQSSFIDPRDAGLDMWNLLMELTNRGDLARESQNEFEDLMLKEWAREHLLNNKFDDEATPSLSSPPSHVIQAGTLLRASNKDRSPFLLKHQEFHKSIVLVLEENESMSIGVILNQPSTKSIQMELVDKITKKKREIEIPIRFGGQYAIRGKSTLQWIYFGLKNNDIGKPLSGGGKRMEERIMEGETFSYSQNDKQFLFSLCTQEEATSAISQGVAKPSDFIIVSGLSVWVKDPLKLLQGQTQQVGLTNEVRKGNFEPISIESSSKTSLYEAIWKKIQKQSVLDVLNWQTNLVLGKEAWTIGKNDSESDVNENEKDELIQGIGEGFDEEDDSLVFKSDVKVSQLSDDALKNWISTFLM